MTTMQLGNQQAYKVACTTPRSRRGSTKAALERGRHARALITWKSSMEAKAICLVLSRKPLSAFTGITNFEPTLSSHPSIVGGWFCKISPRQQGMTMTLNRGSTKFPPSRRPLYQDALHLDSETFRTVHSVIQPAEHE
ncbi:hypothetical protein BKA70DRAFT_838364 [Coprinopsis sp. MPI-PUGE-AT-0042]|nr:hypothetical protein BKA70DRAFT_838364 [Coprinopsis sp. MPI-PUGE-AT-0042]